LADLLERLQTALTGSYRLDRELGGRGMSRVFLPAPREPGFERLLREEE